MAEVTRARGPPWAPLNSHSACHTHLPTHGENHLFKRKSQDKQGVKTGTGKRPRAVFLHPLRYAHAHGVTLALAHAHTNTTSNSQRLIEVSALLIVFVHLGMKEPF